MYLFFFIIFFVSNNTDYAAIYGADYQKALQFCKTNDALFQQKAKYYQLEANELKAVVFPELIRYSAFMDFMETKALEFAYVQKGASSVDFSIGHFQMKPSFVEKLEDMLRQDSQWQKKYASIIHFSDTSTTQIRLERINRLKELSWQLDYLCCFMSIAQKQYARYTKNASERVRCLAAAYNIGFKYGYIRLMQQSTIPSFPYGSKYPKEHQHCYTDIATYYYNN